MIFEQAVVRIIQIILVPTVNKDVIWSIAPLFFGLIMIQMYFGRYKTEQLGWNTAFSNAVSLMWVNAILVRYMYVNYGFKYAFTTPGLKGQMYLVIGLALLTLGLSIVNYRHSLPKQFAFFLSNAVPTTILAYLSLVIVMGRIPVDEVTLIAAITILVSAALIFAIYRAAITSPKYVERALEKRKEKRKKERRRMRIKIKQKVKKDIGKIIPLKKKKK